MRGWKGDKGTGRMCWVCQAACTHEHDCLDFGLSANWRQTMLTAADLGELTAPDHYVSRIWTIPGFVPSYVRPDMMHVCDLGIAQHWVGNCLWGLVKQLGGAFSRPDPACAKLENIAAACARSPGLETVFGGPPHSDDVQGVSTQ